MLKKLSPLLLLCSFELCADPGPIKAPGYTVPTDPTSPTAPIDSSAPEAPIEPIVALDDSITVRPNDVVSMTGNVMANDLNGTSAYLNGSPASEYGTLLFNSDGSFTYTLYKNAPSINKLGAGEVVKDSFSYILVDQFGQSASANLHVTIIGNPVGSGGDTIFEQPKDELYDNVDVEFNNRFADGTPLNSGRKIKGHLLDFNDKDWFYIHSAGNEILKLEVCPQGTSCFGKKSWVLYVFDSALLTAEWEESAYVTFQRWVTETGSTKDILGNTILGSTWAGTSDHLYLAYRLGLFDGALIGIVDPCFDTNNSVELGVGAGERDYLVVVSSPLRGDEDSGDPDECGQGSVILKRPGLSVVGLNSKGEPTSYVTTQEFIAAFPFSDDQYTINVTGTGLHPLLSTSAIAKSSTFNGFTGELNIPKVKVDGKLYSARLVRQGPFSGNTYSFALSALNEFGPEEAADTFQATYNPANQQVLIPRVTDAGNGDAYSVVMQYHPPVNGIPESLEAIAIRPIK